MTNIDLSDDESTSCFWCDGTQIVTAIFASAPINRTFSQNVLSVCICKYGACICSYCLSHVTLLETNEVN